MEAALAAITQRQHGLVTTEQARNAGLSTRAIATRVRTGRWTRLARRVYAVAGAPNTWRQALLAAVLQAGPHAAASHESAAALWGLPGFEEGTVDVTSPFGARHDVTLGRLRQRCLLPAHHLRMVDGVPVTSVPRTLFDLAATVPWKRFERAANNALAMKLVGRADLRAILDELAKRGRPGTTAFRMLVDKLEHTSGVPESGLESDLFEIAEAAGLPAPELQVSLGDEDGFIARVDALWRRQRVILEADGDRFHTAPLDVEADRARDERLTRAGYRVLRIPEGDIRRRKQAVAARLRSAFRQAA
jgi:hypothetical protein